MLPDEIRAEHSVYLTLKQIISSGVSIYMLAGTETRHESPDLFV
jgi:hypothetical protein